MRLDIKRKLFARSDRVKGIDFHPTEPWVLATLYSGSINIWSWETQSLVKTLDLTTVPVRAGRFIARKNWIVTGADDYQIRVHNYNTTERIISFEAHPDYIRCLVVHPTQPFVLSAGDDTSIKLWNWEKGWQCQQVFEGHLYYVMALSINPKDTNTFASACLDRTVKIWSFGNSTPNFTLEAHDQKGVNYVDYYPASDRPYLVTTSDDRTVKIWDYQTKHCIQTLEGHTSNVSFATYHPNLPIIISGSEDGTVKIWHANTYRLEQTLSYGLERAWCVTCDRASNAIAMGFDEGTVVVKLGREEPAVSMDASGKVIWARHMEIQSTIIKDSMEQGDGEKLALPIRDLGSCEVYPSMLQHSPNGRFVVVCGDGEYIIYTALAWRNKSFGSALEFAWSSDSNGYAIRESATSIRVFKNFKEKPGAAKHSFSAEQIFGGSLLGIKGNGFVGFFDWESGNLVRRIDATPFNVFWSENGDLVALACEDALYVLRYDRDAYVNGESDPDEGVEAAFEMITDISETVTTGRWVGDCFIYTNSTNRLNYLVGGHVNTIATFDQNMYLLGYLPRDGKLYLADKDLSVVSYALSLAVLEYQTVVLRGDMETAMELLETIPESQRAKIARFLDNQGFKEQALDISIDVEQKFDLALQLQKLPIAIEIATTTESDHKWKLIGDKALESWDFPLAERSFLQARDYGSLLLLYTSTSNEEGIRRLVDMALENGANNVAFTALWSISDVDGCRQLLMKTGRLPEATLFSMTYTGDKTEEVARHWKDQLSQQKVS